MSRAIVKGEDRAKGGDRAEPVVAVIDDDVQLMRSVARILRFHYHCDVRGYRSVEEFLEYVDAASSAADAPAADLVLLDFHFPGKDGPYLVEELKRRDSPLLRKSRIVGITGDEAEAVSAFRAVGIDAVFLKPLRSIDFKRIAKRAYQASQELDSQAPESVFRSTL